MTSFLEEFKNRYIIDENKAYIINQDDIKEAITCLKNEDNFRFLADITAIDYSKFIEKKRVDLHLFIYYEIKNLKITSY